MESRNIIAESYELKNLKELRLVYPFSQAIAIQIIRTVGYPRKWKADLHGFSLSLLPAVLAFHAGPAVLGTEDVNLTFSTCLYICAVIIVLFIKGFSKDVVGDGAESLNFEVRLIALKLGFSSIVVVLFPFLPAFVSLFSDNPSDEAWAGLIGAAIIALISYKTIALSPEYLLDAKNAPPLLCDRERAVLKTAAVVYGTLVVASLPRLL